MKILALIAVSALALFGVAFVSSAFADETATPTPSISPLPTGSTSDSESSEESEAPEETEAVEPEEVDTEVEELDAENQAEGDAFDEDIAEAEQSGNSEDAMELKEAASIVTSVTVPEVTEMAADNTEAHAIITGTTP